MDGNKLVPVDTTTPEFEGYTPEELAIGDVVEYDYGKQRAAGMVTGISYTMNIVSINRHTLTHADLFLRKPRVIRAKRLKRMFKRASTV